MTQTAREWIEAEQAADELLARMAADPARYERAGEQCRLRRAQGLPNYIDISGAVITIRCETCQRGEGGLNCAECGAVPNDERGY